MIGHLRRLPLYAAVLLEEIPTLISVTRWRVCELDGGHKWGDWHPHSLLGPLSARRECQSCGLDQFARPAAAVRTETFSVPLNMN